MVQTTPASIAGQFRLRLPQYRDVGKGAAGRCPGHFGGVAAADASACLLALKQVSVG